jgi:hypothetical protein
MPARDERGFCEAEEARSQGKRGDRQACEAQQKLRWSRRENSMGNFGVALILLETLIFAFEGLAVFRNRADDIFWNSVGNARLNFHCHFDIRSNDACQVLDYLCGNLSGIAVYRFRHPGTTRCNHLFPCRIGRSWESKGVASFPRWSQLN